MQLLLANLKHGCERGGERLRRLERVLAGLAPDVAEAHAHRVGVRVCVCVCVLGQADTEMVGACARSCGSACVCMCVCMCVCVQAHATWLP